MYKMGNHKQIADFQHIVACLHVTSIHISNSDCLWHPAVKMKVVLLLKRRCFKIGVLCGLLCCGWEAETCFPAFKANIFFFFSSLLALPLYHHVFSAAVSKACLVSYCSLFQKYQIIHYADWLSKCRFSFSLKTKIILLINLAEIEYSRCRFCWGFF